MGSGREGEGRGQREAEATPPRRSPIFGLWRRVHLSLAITRLWPLPFVAPCNGRVRQSGLSGDDRGRGCWAALSCPSAGPPAFAGSTTDGSSQLCCCALGLPKTLLQPAQTLFGANRRRVVCVIAESSGPSRMPLDHSRLLHPQVWSWWWWVKAAGVEECHPAALQQGVK